VPNKVENATKGDVRYGHKIRMSLRFRCMDEMQMQWHLTLLQRLKDATKIVFKDLKGQLIQSDFAIRDSSIVFFSVLTEFHMHQYSRDSH